jgi:hypothetical protein
MDSQAHSKNSVNLSPFFRYLISHHKIDINSLERKLHPEGKALHKPLWRKQRQQHSPDGDKEDNQVEFHVERVEYVAVGWDLEKCIRKEELL